MDFVTIHELSREFDLPARVVRYRLLSFLKSGKLHEGEDFRREDYKDDRHFVWKVNPVSFMRESGLKPKTLPVVSLPVVNDPLSTVNQTDSNDRVSVNEQNGSVNKTPEQTAQIDNKNPSEEFRAALEREMIDFLKDQIAVKDHQISELTNQSKEINELNVKLMGATLQQSKKIEELSRLVGNEQPAAEKSVNDPLSTVNHVDNERGGAVKETPNEFRMAA